MCQWRKSETQITSILDEMMLYIYISFSGNTAHHTRQNMLHWQVSMGPQNSWTSYKHPWLKKGFVVGYLSLGSLETDSETRRYMHKVYLGVLLGDISIRK